MKPWQRVALRYAKENPITIVETNEFFDVNSTHGLDVMSGGKRVGYIEGEIHFIPFEKLDDFECSEDMKTLYELWHDSLPRNEWSRGIPVFEVLHSLLKPEAKNKRIGIEMYKQLANMVREEVGKAIFFIPNYCHRSGTSPDALRVWKSLTRSNLSEGDVILMVNYKLR